MTPTHLTLLAQDFGQQASSVDGRRRYPTLERLLARGRCCRIDSVSSNHLRFALFGIETTGVLPVAALTQASNRRSRSRDDYYSLRSDPVTMWADMARVFMTHSGFADLDPFERNELENCVRGVLLEEGIQLHADHPERWCIALDAPLDFSLTPLEAALDMDLADALPNHPQGRYWRRVLDEIRVALHHCPLNMRRRATGRQEINSVWFWGGGFVPDAAPRDLFDTVYSNHPVSSGLAIINDCKLRKQSGAGRGGFGGDGRSVLIDWLAEGSDPGLELGRIDRLLHPLLQRVEENRLVLTFYDGSGEGRVVDRRTQRRFWRRAEPVGQAAMRPVEA